MNIKPDYYQMSVLFRWSYLCSEKMNERIHK